ncbi:MAG: hypothetical protein ACXWUK_08795 [Burkholderiales bacterium]
MQTLRMTLLAVAVAAALVGCGPKSPSTATVIEDKVYSVTPPAMTVKVGIVTAELSDMKVTERVEKDSGRIETPAKLTAKLKLQNSSPDQTVRLISGKMVYVDIHGNPIKIEEARTEPVIRFTSASSSQLDPGQDTTQSIDVDFPANALKAKTMKEMRLDLVYTPATFRQETARLAVTIGPSEPLAASAK